MIVILGKHFMECFTKAHIFSVKIFHKSAEIDLAVWMNFNYATTVGCLVAKRNRMRPLNLKVCTQIEVIAGRYAYYSVYRWNRFPLVEINF